MFCHTITCVHFWTMEDGQHQILLHCIHASEKEAFFYQKAVCSVCGRAWKVLYNFSVTLHYIHYTTLHYITCITLHYTTLHTICYMHYVTYIASHYQRQIVQKLKISPSKNFLFLLFADKWFSQFSQNSDNSSIINNYNNFKGIEKSEIMSIELIQPATRHQPQTHRNEGTLLLWWPSWISWDEEVGPCIPSASHRPLASVSRSQTHVLLDAVSPKHSTHSAFSM